MKRMLLTAVIGLWAEAALAQGVFTYSFVGDTSSWNVYAQFQATEAAVGSGYLGSSNTFGGLLSLGGQKAPLWDVNLSVDSLTGVPTGPSSDWTAVAYVAYTEVEILGGTPSSRYWETRIAVYPWTGQAANEMTQGRWTVDYAGAPEPGAPSLMLMGAWVLKKAARRREPQEEIRQH